MHREICTLTDIHTYVHKMYLQTCTLVPMYHTEIDIRLCLPSYPNTRTAFTLPPPSPFPQLTGHGRINQCSYNPNERSQQSVWCGGSLQWSPDTHTIKMNNDVHSGQYQRRLKLLMKNDREILSWPAGTPLPCCPNFTPLSSTCMNAATQTSFAPSGHPQ